MQTLLVVFLALAASTITTAHNTPHARRTLAESPATTCRLETSCTNQPCSPASYEYDAATAGLNFPYTVSYTTTADATTTTFIFLVCSKAKALGGCTPASPGCSPLAAFQLRTRDDIVSRGATVAASPAGTSWATCYPQGTGYKWEGPALGNLSAQAPSAADTCESFSVATGVGPFGQAAQLPDICQQNVSVVSTKDNTTVVDTSSYLESCLYTLTLSSGRTAYGVLGTPATAPAPSTSAAGARASRPHRHAAAPSHGPTPYGRRRLGASLLVDGRPVGRLF